jgi:hypothetical protein
MRFRKAAKTAKGAPGSAWYRPFVAPPPPHTIPPAALTSPAAAGPRGHFRAHERREVHLTVGLVGQRSGVERPALVVDISLAGARVETEESLVPGEQIAVTLATPTLWDPLVVHAVVAWAQPPQAAGDLDAIGRPRLVARAGLAFEYPSPRAVLAMFEMLAALTYE